MQAEIKYIKDIRMHKRKCSLVQMNPKQLCTQAQLFRQHTAILYLLRRWIRWQYTWYLCLEATGAPVGAGEAGCEWPCRIAPLSFPACRCTVPRPVSLRKSHFYWPGDTQHLTCRQDSCKCIRISIAKLRMHRTNGKLENGAASVPCK